MGTEGHPVSLQAWGGWLGWRGRDMLVYFQHVCVCVCVEVKPTLTIHSASLF